MLQCTNTLDSLKICQIKLLQWRIILTYCIGVLFEGETFQELAYSNFLKQKFSQNDQENLVTDTFNVYFKSKNFHERQLTCENFPKTWYTVYYIHNYSHILLTKCAKFHSIISVQYCYFLTREPIPTAECM